MSYVRKNDFFRHHRGAASGLRLPILLPYLMLASIALLVLSRIGHPYISTLRTEVAGFVAPTVKTMMVPFEPLRQLHRRFSATIHGLERLDDLRAENQRLKHWQWKAEDLERRLADLSIQSRVVRQQRLPYVTVRVIAQETGPFAHSVLVDGGRSHGIREGYPVINAYGLVGRVISTGKQVSRVLLLTDYNSRIPVKVGTTGKSAILVGGNKRQPTLRFYAPARAIEPGTIVVTSGIGGVLPPGMRVGTVSKAPTNQGPATPAVKLDSALGELTYLSILFYQNPASKLERPPSSTKSTASKLGRNLAARGK